MQTRIIDFRSIGGRPTAVMVGEFAVEELGGWLGEVYGEIGGLLGGSDNPPVGPPFARYHRLEEGRFRVEAGFPVGRPFSAEGDVQASSLPGCTVAVTTHIGPYDDMEATYEAIDTWLESRGATPDGDPWEVYFSDPEEPQDSWRTDIYQPFRPS